MLKKIAVTGGIATGKTAVCLAFQELGALVVSADAIVHELLAHDTHLGQQITRKFGPDVLRDGVINRALLAEKVFQNPKELIFLEKLLHPMVLQKIEKTYQLASQSAGYSAFVAEVPLLFEAGWAPLFDAVVTVVADVALCKERFAQSGHSPEDYDRRMQRQFDQRQKAALSQFTIQNNGSLNELKSSAESLYRIITQGKSSS